MDLRTFQAFVEVVRRGGFSAAAETLHSTQSTVSKAVRRLEDDLGLPLVDRSGPRAVPTAAGEIVLKRALAILAERDDLVAELAELRGLARGTLRLGLPPIGSNTLFAPMFAAYRARFPGIEVRLVEFGSKRLEELVLAGELDLAGSLLPMPADFDWQEVRREPIDVIVPADDLLAARPVVGLAEIAARPFLLFGEGFALDPIILGACRRAGFQPRVAARSGQIDFILELVAARLGLGFLPRMIAEHRHRDDLVHVPVADEHMVWHMALIWRRGAFVSHAARAWLALARDNAEKARDRAG